MGGAEVGILLGGELDSDCDPDRDFLCDFLEAAEHGDLGGLPGGYDILKLEAGEECAESLAAESCGEMDSRVPRLGG